MRKTLLSILFSAIFAASISAQTTEFTYQGSLQNGGTAANGTYDFEFRLFDAASGGTQIGTTLTRSSVAVASGSFAVKLDFGSGPFPASNRFLEISVRLGGGAGAFTPLSPRPQITSSPYSIQATRAQFADNAGALAGIAANQYVQTTDPRLSDSRPPSAGSTNYIQNSTTAQAASNFNISGTGTAGVLNATTQYNLNGAGIFRFGNNNQSMYVGVGAGDGLPATIANESDNTIVGAFAGSMNFVPGTQSSANVFMGWQAGRSASGSGNSFFGYQAGRKGNGSPVQQNSVTLLGSYSNAASDLTNATAVGSGAFVAQSNSLVLGSDGTNVGTGTNAPNFRLHVRANGQDGIKIQHTGTGGFPQIRWTDANDVFKASIGVDTSGTGSMNMFVNGADRMILKSNGVVQVPGPLFINNPNTLIITSPNGACWGITVSNTGVLSTFPVTPCP